MARRLIIEYPPNYAAERRYICDVLFRDFLGLDYSVEPQDRSVIRIRLEGDPAECQVVLPDVLFQTSQAHWLSEDSLPERPLRWWSLPAVLSEAPIVSGRLPVIYGREPYYEERDGKVSLGVDIFGSAFFMLARYEEVVKPDRDRYGRFPAKASIAYQEAFLERPIVNEYLEVLWKVLTSLWPGLQRRPREYRLLLSHDVDRPLCVVGAKGPFVLGCCLGDLMKRRDASLAWRRLHSHYRARKGMAVEDLCNTFELIMDVSERHGLRSAFYFIAGRSAGRIDGFYSLDAPWVRGLMRRIYERGHELGVHPSYNTYRNSARTKEEFEKLLCVAEEERIYQEKWGGRQHFLRWENPLTWQNWEDAGLHYDSTVGYADHVGFRCGTCYAYTPFNLRIRRPLKLKERPLIATDVTLIGYMGLSLEEAIQRTSDLHATCRGFQGDFTLLWHNHNLVSRGQKYAYLQLTEELRGS